jgi:protocatechuate 3,4-dioxygenase beta subunit
MKNYQPARLTRREFLWASLTGALSFLLAACGLQAPRTQAPQAATSAPPTSIPPTPTQPAPTQAPAPNPAPTQAAQILPPTPACGDADDATPAQTEGPFFTPSSPERASLLEPGLAGTRLVVTGRVLTTDCRPVAGALLDFWHADDAGVYDNVGYKLRGHQFADEAGSYTLETIVPGLYTGRTRHIHVKVQAPNQPVLTTQLYFPGEPGNASDSIYNPALEMEVQAAAEGRSAAFDFVLDIR